MANYSISDVSGKKQYSIKDVASERYEGKASDFRKYKYGEDARTGKEYFKDKKQAAFLGASDMVTLGFLDEATGGLLSLHPDITYDNAVGAVRDLQSTSRERDPYAYGGGGLLGGMASGMAAAPKTALQMMGLAAGEGAVYGYGSGEGSERVPGALKGGAVGLATSALFPGFTSAWNAAKKFVNPNVANRQLKTIVDATGKTPKQLQAIAERYNPKYTSLMNTSEDTIAASARGISQQDPLARQIIRQNVKGQTSGAKNRINQTLDGLSDVPRDYWNKYSQLENVQKTNAKKLFPKAMQGQVDMTDELTDIMNHPLTQKAWKEARGQAEAKGQKLPKLYATDDEGVTAFSGDVIPTMDDIQAIKFGYDDTINAYKKQAKMGSSASAPGKYRNATILKKRFMNEVEEFNPDFIEANKVWGGDQTTRNALEKGRQASTTNINDRLNDIKSMTKSEKDAYLQGILSDFNHRLGVSPKDKAASLNFMQNENMQKTIEALLPKKQANSLYNRLNAEVRYKENSQIAMGGSQTADNLDVGGKMSDKARDALMMVTTPKTAIPIQFYKWLSESKVDPKVWQDLASVITKQGGVDEALKRAATVGMSQAKVNAMRQTASKYGLIATSAALPGLLN